MLDLPFILVALPGADGEESPGLRDRWNRACIPAQLLMEKPWQVTSLSIRFLICQIGMTLPALRAGWED